MNILGIIPARYASTRFPAKALASIAGKTMVQRVYEQCAKATLLNDIVVATDNEEILAHVQSFGGKAVITSEHHQSGTDRCYEVLHKLNAHYDYVINIQGDEPCIAPQQIDILAGSLDGRTELATLVHQLKNLEDLLNPAVVKVVFNRHHEALYFSRSPIPFARNATTANWLEATDYYKHIGIYAYRADVLQEITSLPPSRLELTESLEQLRWLEQGYKIQTAITPYDSYGVDLPEDVAKVERLIWEMGL